MNTPNQHPIPAIVRESQCPDLNWMLKPGERVRYYRRAELAEARADLWVEISASDAYAMAERYDKEQGR